MDYERHEHNTSEVRRDASGVGGWWAGSLAAGRTRVCSHVQPLARIRYKYSKLTDLLRTVSVTGG